MSRSRVYTRYQRRAHIGRKKRIIKEVGCWYTKFDGQLSKGKIHCSCPMCRMKSYDERQARDIRRSDAMDYSENAAWFNQNLGGNAPKFPVRVCQWTLSKSYWSDNSIGKWAAQSVPLISVFGVRNYKSHEPFSRREQYLIFPSTVLIILTVIMRW